MIVRNRLSNATNMVLMKKTGCKHQKMVSLRFDPAINNKPIITLDLKRIQGKNNPQAFTPWTIKRFRIIMNSSSEMDIQINSALEEIWE